MSDASKTSLTSSSADASPARAGLVLGTLILGASVANLNLAVANVALPSIGVALGASQTSLDLVAVGFSLGLAASVLYLGAVADRYGRRLMLLTGLALSIPTAAAAAWAPNVGVLVVARVGGGLAAGMAFPTTLSLVSALFAGAPRTRAIALWSGVGGGASALGPVVAGALVTHFWWGSAFVVTIPLAAVALILAWRVLPTHAGEGTEQVDHTGGVLSVVLVASLVLAISEAPEPGRGALVVALAVVAVATGIGFWLRERRAPNPLFDLDVAGRRVFWVAFVAGLIVFGSLMGAMFIGQQFLQDVLGYSALSAGLAILPAAVLMVVVSPVAARLIGSRGTRFTLIAGYVATAAGFALMLTWKAGVGYAPVGLAYALIGAGVGLGGAPASRAIMASVPIRKAGMGSASNDLQRDLGGAVMQSILGALLSLRYSSYFTAAFANLSPDQRSKLGGDAATAISKSFGGAQQVAKQYPQADADKILSAAKEAFTKGSHAAVGFALAATLIGLAVAAFAFPDREREAELEARYAAEDAEA